MIIVSSVTPVYPIPSLSCVACHDGDIVLSNGSVISTSLTEGTVLVCINDTYQTVCDDLWDEPEAGVVCRQLGYSGEGISHLQCE